MKRPSAASSLSIPPSSGGSGTGTSNLNSYQHGTTASGLGSMMSGYQPPIFYAADQTRVLEDTTKAFYQADESANQVLSQLSGQRQQIVGAHDNVYRMRDATDKAKREMEELRSKYRQKKQKLYMWIAGLAFVDILLFLRMLQCHGNFYCLY
jgi:hypothetical protein